MTGTTFLLSSQAAQARDEIKEIMNVIEIYANVTLAFDHVQSNRRVGVAADKVKALVEAREQQSGSEVRSFLGLVNYSERFIFDLATLSEPLRGLTKKGQSSYQLFHVFGT